MKLSGQNFQMSSEKQSEVSLISDSDSDLEEVSPSRDINRTCITCGKYFSSKRDLTSHLEVCNVDAPKILIENEPIKTEDDEPFLSSTPEENCQVEAKIEVLPEKRPKLFECDKCGFVTSCRKGLERHIEIHFTRPDVYNACQLRPIAPKGPLPSQISSKVEEPRRPATNGLDPRLKLAILKRQMRKIRPSRKQMKSMTSLKVKNPQLAGKELTRNLTKPSTSLTPAIAPASRMRTRASMATSLTPSTLAATAAVPNQSDATVYPQYVVANKPAKARITISPQTLGNVVQKQAAAPLVVMPLNSPTPVQLSSTPSPVVARNPAPAPVVINPPAVAPVRVFVCEICQQQFSDAPNLLLHKQQHQSVYNITSFVAECSLCHAEVADFKKFFVHLLAHNNSRAFSVQHKLVRTVKVKDDIMLAVNPQEVSMRAINPKSVTIQPIGEVKVGFTEAENLTQAMGSQQTTSVNFKVPITREQSSTQAPSVTSTNQKLGDIRIVTPPKSSTNTQQNQSRDQFPIIKLEEDDVIMLDD